MLDMQIIRRRLFQVTVLLFVCLAAVPRFRAAEPLPAQLTDEAFWKMITEFSEEGGFFRFENFLSNELGFQYVIPALKELTKPGGVYMGVGPEQNFTYIAALEPKMAFITDIRRQNMLELMMYKAFFEQSTDRADFMSRLFARKRPPQLDPKSTADELFVSFRNVQPDPELFRKNLDDLKNVLLKQHKFGLSDEDVSNIEYVYKVFIEAGPDIDYQVGGGGFGGGGTPTYMDLMTMNDGDGMNRSFLGTEENYRRIREMQMKNLIIPLVGDFGGSKALRAVGEYLKDHDSKVTAFYLSNVEQYLFQDNKWRRFYANVATLPLDSSSQFIRSVNGGGNIRGQYRGGFGMRFQSLLSPMQAMVAAFQEGRIRYYGDVISMSRP
jgi:hypothetical protein